MTTPLGHRVRGLGLDPEIKVCGLAIAQHDAMQRCLEYALKAALPFESSVASMRFQDTPEREALVPSQVPPHLNESHVLVLVPDLNATDAVGRVLHVRLLQCHWLIDSNLTHGCMTVATPTGRP